MIKVVGNALPRKGKALAQALALKRRALAPPKKREGERGGTECVRRAWPRQLKFQKIIAAKRAYGSHANKSEYETLYPSAFSAPLREIFLVRVSAEGAGSRGSRFVSFSMLPRRGTQNQRRRM
jgi:hypothetical protein